MDKEQFIEYIEIWCPAEDGEAIQFETGKKLKRIAVLANGHPIFLAKDVYMERRPITKEEEKNLISAAKNEEKKER